MKILCTALVAAGLLAGSSAAFAGDREAVTLKVNAASVDFANPAAVAQFRKEVARTIEAVCNPGDRVGADTAPDFQCRREMAANVEPTVSRLAAAASNNSHMATN